MQFIIRNYNSFFSVMHRMFCFFWMYIIKKIELPSSITNIEPYAFCKCSSLKKVKIPSSVTEISRNLFYECTSLAQVTFESPSSIELILSFAFGGCSSLKEIVKIFNICITLFLSVKRKS